MGGANNGMAGQTMRLYELNPHEKVDIVGCTDKVQMTDMPVGTYHSIITADSGQEVIGVFHNFVGYGEGKSILSKSQCESYGLRIDDRLHKFGGSQSIMTPDVYVLKLKYTDGLLWLPIRMPTNIEEEKLVHVNMTSPGKWDPSDEETEWSPTTEEPSTQDLIEFYDERDGVLIGDGEEVDKILSIVTVDSRSKKAEMFESLRPFLGWKPSNIIKKTFESTTQYGTYNVRLPLRRHFKSRYPALCVKRLDEWYATDTIYASVRAYNGVCCVQLFVGRYSFFTSVWGMKTDAEFPTALMDFIRKFGAMKGLKSGNSKALMSKTVKDVLRQYCIDCKASEPMNQWQNLDERSIQEVKNLTRTLMDRTGTPEYLWNLAITYACVILNTLAHKSLYWNTPIEVSFGVTTDISNLLVFTWYQPVLYHVHDCPFPASRELSGRFFGISENVGDALTFLIRTDDTHKIISRSVVRPLTDEDPNLRVPEPKIEKVEPVEFTASSDKNMASNNDSNYAILKENDLLSSSNNQLPYVDPMGIVGNTFLRDQDDGSCHRFQIVEPVRDGKDYLIKDKSTDNEEVITYFELLKYLDREATDPGQSAWRIRSIL